VSRRLGPALGVSLALGVTLAEAQPAPSRTEESLQAFAQIVTVMRHPRCLNCHQAGDAPRQTDARTPHLMLMARGPDGFGTPALRCPACHQETNTADGRVPGAPNWQLAPKSMGWDRLNDAQMCRALKDPDRNGQRPPADLVKHALTDPLVLWAWSPGDRTTPPITHREFAEAMTRWVRTGAACD
jgi:hypothetical protein